MSTVAGTVYNTNKACCTIPPVLSDYTPKGSFRPHGAFKKVYVTGPEQSDKSIVAIYDIFGYVICTSRCLENLSRCHLDFGHKHNRAQIS